MDNEKAIRAAKLTLGGILEKRRAKTAIERAQGQIAPSKYMPGVPRAVHADGGRVDDGIAAAETVAGMLRDGREKEITNDHLNSADPQHLWKLYETGQTGMDLPMDSASRMERAKAMGMTNKGYHSTLKDTDSFDPAGKFMGYTGTSGISTTDNPKAASRYLDRYGEYDYKGVPFEKNIIPTVSDIGRTDVRDAPYKSNIAMGAPLPKGYIPEHVRRGFDSAQFPDAVSAKGSVKHSDAKNAVRSTETVMSDPAKIRSRFARFDPRLAHLSHLSAATGGRAVHASGGYVPMASLPIPKLAVASPLAMNRQPGFLDVLGTLNKVAGSARTLSDLVSPEEEAAPEPQAARAEAGNGMSPEAVAAYSALMKAYGEPLTVNSSYRDPEHNERVGGAKDSQHTHGNAYDFNVSGMPHDARLRLADMAWDAGFRGVGFYDNSMHFDVGDPRAWGPSHSRDSIPDWAQGWAQERYGYADGGPAGMGDNGGPPLSEPPVDLGQAREAKQMQTFHTGMMDDIHQRMMNAMEAHEKAVGQGVFDGYEVGDTLQGSAHPMRITGRYMQKWKPTLTTLRSFDRMGTKPTIIEHEGEQYIPMLRYETGKEGMDGFQQGSSYLDGVKAAGYQKMGGLRAVKAAGGSVDVPQKTQKAYKLFRTKGDGKLYPLFVNADKPVPMGEWLEAEEGPQGKSEGKVKSKLGDLAYRPGWHAGDLPMATHIGGKSDPSLKKPDYRPDNHVWAEVEMAADKDWQSVADSRGKGVKAHITDQVPYGGFYRYKTNPNMTGNWLIGGNMKVNRVLPDEEVKAINDQAGTADLPRRSEGFAAGGAAMFEGMHEDLQNEDGSPMELWHGTPGEGFSEFKDDKLGSRDTGFFGRGHYLTPDQGSAEEYADPNQMGEGTVMGPLHAALKNPYVWDASDKGAHSTLRDLQSMGIMKDKDKLEAWDNLQRHHIDPFMREMQKRGHDGVVVRTNDYTGEKPHRVSEVVVFKPSAIKHRDAERFDPNDPNIYRANGGAIK